MRFQELHHISTVIVLMEEINDQIDSPLFHDLRRRRRIKAWVHDIGLREHGGKVVGHRAFIGILIDQARKAILKAMPRPVMTLEPDFLESSPEPKVIRERPARTASWSRLPQP